MQPATSAGPQGFARKEELMKHKKTNAMRLLEGQKIPYALHEYASGGQPLSGVHVAGILGRDAAGVFKTLVAKGAKGGVYVFCIPVASELDLKAAARAAGEKSVAMVPVADITPLTGYVRGGCSPVGMKRPYPTFIHESALQQPQILVSGGRIGLQIEIAPQALAAATGAHFAPLAVAPAGQNSTERSEPGQK